MRTTHIHSVQVSTENVLYRFSLTLDNFCFKGTTAKVLRRFVFHKVGSSAQKVLLQQELLSTTYQRYSDKETAFCRSKKEALKFASFILLMRHDPQKADFVGVF